MRTMTDTKDDDEAPPTPAEEGPAEILWRLSSADRALFARIKKMSRLPQNPDVLRFALGAAEREMTRAGGSS